MDMLHIDNLHKSFGDKRVLHGLSLSVPEHSIFGFIGKNGAGKTTTMKAVLGLLHVDAGEILVGGERVTYGKSATNRHVGYLPDVPAFYSFMTAPEYLRFCGEITGMKRTHVEARSAELLRLVGLHGLSALPAVDAWPGIVAAWRLLSAAGRCSPSRFFPMCIARFQGALWGFSRR